MRHLAIRGLLLAAPCLVGCAPEAADPVEGCEACAPTFETVAELRFGDAPAGPTSAFGEIFIAHVPGTDQWLVAIGSSLLLLDGPSPGQILVPVASFVREIGRSGSGPGEHGYVRGLHFDGADSLLVVDSGNHRVDVHAPDLRFVRSIPLSVSPYHSDLMSDGRLLIAGSVAGRPPFDRYLARIVDRVGEVVEVVDAPRFETEADRDYAFATVTAEGTGFRMSRPFAYTAVRFTGDGEVRDSIAANPAWFVPADYSDPGYAMFGLEETRPSITALMTDSAGILWIQTTRPVTTDSLPDPETVLSGGPATVEAFARSILDFAIEAYDAETGARLAGQLYPDPTYFIGDGYGYQYIEDPNSGAIDVRVVRFEVPPAGR